MKDFPIKFTFDTVDYTARVVSFAQNAQFHINGFIPKMGGIELPFVVYKKRSGGYAWKVSKDMPEELGQAIFDAIKKSQKL
jgi:hypothetical protein